MEEITYSLRDELMKEFYRLSVKEEIINYIKSHSGYVNSETANNTLQRSMLTTALYSALLKLNVDVPRELRICFTDPTCVKDWLHIMHITVVPFIKYNEVTFNA